MSPAVPRIGLHVSNSGGAAAALERAVESGCDAFQLFPSNPRMWRSGAELLAGEEDFRAHALERDVAPIVIHSIYLINLATGDPELRAKSVDALSFALRRASAIGAAEVVTHLGNVPAARKLDGSEYESAMSAGRERVAEAVLAAYDIWSEWVRGAGKDIAGNDIAGLGLARPPRLLLEGSAGARSSIACTPADVARVIKLTGGTVPIGLCVDTCHAHAAGYDLSTAEGRDRLLGEVESEVGRDALGVLHCNDSKGEAGSHLDRHEHIGAGTIGADGFKALLGYDWLRRTTWILETPGSPEDDFANVASIRRYAQGH